MKGSSVMGWVVFEFNLSDDQRLELSLELNR